MKSEALKILDKMAWDAKKAKYTDMPEHILTSKKYKDNTANNLTRAVIDFINLSGYQAERISVTGRRIDKRKTYQDAVGRTKQIGSISWVKSSMRKGTADISAIIKDSNGNPIPWKIEIKIGKDRQSQHQKEYENEVKQAGGYYSIVRSFDDFYKQYCELMYK